MKFLTWLRELGAAVGTFDRSALEPGFALRCTIGVAIPLVIAAVHKAPALGVPAAIGAFITGFTSLQGVHRTRLKAIVTAGFGMSLASFVGALASSSTPGLVAATFVAGYAVGTIGQIGPVASTVALNSFVAFILFSSQPLTVAAAAQDSALVLAGGIIQAALVLLAWPFARRGAERAALADVYRNLAVYATALADNSHAFPPITPLATARQVLADPQPFADAAEIARLRRLLEDSEIIRRRLGALAVSAPSNQSPAALSRVVANAAHELSKVADLLGGERTIAARGTKPAIHEELEIAGIDDLEAHLRDALEAATMLATGRVPAFDLLSKPRPGPYIRSHVDWLSRDSFRFALVLAIAMVLARHFQADRGYWIPLTAAIVLKPDFQTTFLRGFARIGGTLAGAVIATFVAVPLRGHAALQTIGLLVTSALAYLAFNPNYALFTVAITSFVVIVLGMRGLPGTTTVDARMLDTLAGGALAMVGYLVLPSREHRRTRALLADLLDAQRRLAKAILLAYASPADDRRRAIETARTDVWKVRTTVEASIGRTRNEPYRSQTIGAERALRILAASQRFGLATLALETALETQGSFPIPQLLPFAAALDSEMAELAAALRESRAARFDERLAPATAAIERELSNTADAGRRFVLERLIAYAHAAMRIRRLVTYA
ncbi:MAG: FUSC family protein [Candidatus Eremiobacteraeota bacterium]|nr:FUSC family protein [Candidatus Eremiobacteraeota bacterium]